MKRTLHVPNSLQFSAIAWGSGEAGREIEGPMAWVILGGLATSTVLNLVLLPIVYCSLTTEQWSVARSIEA